MLSRNTTIARLALVLGFGILLSACAQNWSAEDLQDLRDKRSVAHENRD